MTEKDVILSLDIGTTNIKLAAVNRNGETISLQKRTLRLQCPQPGHQEICPAELWTDIETLFKVSVKGLESRIAALGISTHRSTFITWERGTDRYLHNFITWADKRTQQMCDDWNNSYVTRICQTFLYGIGKLVGSTHMVCAANFKVVPANVQMRFKWVMENVPSAKTLHNQGNLCFGTLDTWLIYKLTGKATWATDYSNAAATGIYDLWAGKWCPVMTWVFGNPIGSLPEVVDSNASFGYISPDINLGCSNVPIHGVVADQQASVIGNRLFEEGDVKLSLGTGLACDRLTGSYAHPVALSVYPQIAWKLRGAGVYYMAESMTMETRGKYMDWLVTSNLVKDLKQVDSIAMSVEAVDTPYFIKVDAIDNRSIKDFMEAKGSNCTDAHYVRAVMEAHAFRSKVLLDDVFDFYGLPDKLIVDGGASSSTFILESLSALTGLDVYRSNCAEGALMGAFVVTGIGLNWWHSFADIELPKQATLISPLDCDRDLLLEKFKKWKTLVEL
ncbi:hypothetical protein ACHWQZ_G010457 [Mnemiopsis leidyi]